MAEPGELEALAGLVSMVRLACRPLVVPVLPARLVELVLPARLVELVAVLPALFVELEVVLRGLVAVLPVRPSGLVFEPVVVIVLVFCVVALASPG